MEQQPSEPKVKLLNKLESRWLLPLAVAGAVFFVLSLIAGLATWVASAGLVRADNQANNVNAKSVLVNAAADANQYAVDNSGTFTDMSADTLNNIDSQIQWVDGPPASGQVGITAAGQDTFTLTYVDADGNTYRATRDSRRKTRYTTAAGQSL